LHVLLGLKFVRQVNAPKVALWFQRFEADLLFIQAKLSNPLDSELGSPGHALHNYDRSGLNLRQMGAIYSCPRRRDVNRMRQWVTLSMETLTDNTIVRLGDLRLFSIGMHLLPPLPFRDLRVA
jgi:hypothetical protein